MAETGVVTSELLWRSAVAAALVDAPLLVFAARLVPLALFRVLKWYLVGAALLVFAVIWGVVGSYYFWDDVYSAIFPLWFRWLLPAFSGVLYAVLALVFWFFSGLARRWQVLCFILLGGVVSLAGHAIGISRGLLRVPLLAHASTASALVFGVFEFIFYWCVVVALAAAGRSIAFQVGKPQTGAAL